MHVTFPTCYFPAPSRNPANGSGECSKLSLYRMGGRMPASNAFLGIFSRGNAFSHNMLWTTSTEMVKFEFRDHSLASCIFMATTNNSRKRSSSDFKFPPTEIWLLSTLEHVDTAYALVTPRATVAHAQLLGLWTRRTQAACSWSRLGSSASFHVPSHRF